MKRKVKRGKGRQAEGKLSDNSNNTDRAGESNKENEKEKKETLIFTFDLNYYHSILLTHTHTHLPQQTPLLLAIDKQLPLIVLLYYNGRDVAFCVLHDRVCPSVCMLSVGVC